MYIYEIVARALIIKLLLKGVAGANMVHSALALSVEAQMSEH